VLGSVHDPLIFLYTGRLAVRAFPSLWRPDPAQVSAELAAAGARYLVDLPCPEDGAWAGAQRAWRAWIAEQAPHLTRVYDGAGGHIRVWRLDGVIPGLTRPAAPPPAPGNALG